MILTHRNADPDAVASAFLAERVLSGWGVGSCILLPEGLSRVSKHILSQLGVQLRLCTEVDRDAALLILDSSNSTQLGAYKDLLIGRKAYIIDHHSPGDLSELAVDAVIEPVAPSTTQLLVKGLVELNFKLDQEASTLALAGIIYDTKRYQIADATAFEASAILIKWGGDYGKASRILAQSRQEDVSERLAKLKALQRVRLGRACNDILIAVTHIGSFESRVAKALLDIGADVAIVVSRHESEVRVSVRVSNRALESGVKAATLASYLGEKLGGKGGGHDAAGLLHIPGYTGDIEALADSIARSIPGKVGRICVEHRRGATIEQGG